MHRDDVSDFLLFIEPKNKKQEPIIDEWTNLLDWAVKMSEAGISSYSNIEETNCISFVEGCRYKGVHFCLCGEVSSNQDYLLQNGMVTNSLCVHYLTHHRNEIPINDFKKLQKLKDFYETNKLRGIYYEN